MKKTWGGNRRKRFYSEMWETLFEGKDLWKSCGTLHDDGPIKTVEYIWVNIWCMLDEDFVTQIALAKSQSMRRASHLPAYLGSCLTTSHMCLPCLPR